MKPKAQCLLCNAPPSPHEEEDLKMGKVWGREMEVMFALQHVLQVPASLLAKFLAETATGNVGLLTLCHACRQLVGECREVDEQLQMLQRRWIKCCARVVAKVKSGEEDGSPERSVLDGGADLRKATRRFVMNHAYPFGELKRLPDNQRAEGPEEETRETNDIPDPPSPPHEDSVIGAESGVPMDGPADRVVLAEKETSDISPTPEIAAVTEAVGEIAVAVAKSVSPSHECLFCRKQFKRKPHLERHLRVHTGERPFWCGVCGKEFNLSEHLSRHQRTHTGEKPHQCKLCPKRFTQSSHLNMHMRIHSGEKPWKCPDCGKAFVLKGGLTTHRVVHTGGKPFECNLCHMKFAYASNLSAHRRKSH